VSVLALTCADARAVLQVVKGFDRADSFSRVEADKLELFPPRPATFRFGVPRPRDLQFFGDSESAGLFARAIPLLQGLGGQRVEIDFTPFRETAQLLYDGPWVAERLAALKDFYAAHADAFLPVTRRIIGGAARYSAVDAFQAIYRLQELKGQTATAWEKIDLMLLPTTATAYKLEQVEADPLQPNTNLGYYTNFVNLLDLCAVALPCAFRQSGVPFGVTLVAPAWSDGLLCAVGTAYQARLGGRLGATQNALPARRPD
jgi:allophanate hydrolase